MERAMEWLGALVKVDTEASTVTIMGYETNVWVAVIVSGLVVLCTVYFSRSRSPPPAVRSTSKQIAERMKAKEIPILEEVVRIFNLPIKKLPIAVDLPRLARRIKVIAPGEDRLKLIKEWRPDVSVNSNIKNNPERISYLADILYEIAEGVETQDSKFLEAYHDLIDKYIRESKNESDLPLGLGSIFQELQMENSKTMTVFKAIQQRVIFAPAYRIKRKLMEVGHITKDLHTADAWRIFVDYSLLHSHHKIIVKHIRKERSASELEAEYFEVEWSLEVAFSEEMEVKSAELMVLSLECCDKMPSDLQLALKSALDLPTS
eukprot:CAMPEP_0174262778 /NCGR_PEP_ID=MMETSP0439-20130205/15372_1 /TAXON_ID=0 /ORGANISM="Stereomyxa ramosa, Strain Chinc5" /LENGTH=318 /DNA_ID=CAMNT_0015347731 /DNA_START=88 /DNA_END=1044 /DNA_ORIENTATION=+